MPRRQSQTKPDTLQAMKNTAYESRAISWLMQDGWQVFTPVLDHGHQTDILISDGPNFHRIQIKTVAATGDNHTVHKAWKEDCRVDVVVYFARNSTWGVIAPAFAEESRPLNHESHRRFQQSKKEFLREFHLF
jgi:hypothetical protein